MVRLAHASMGSGGQSSTSYRLKTINTWLGQSKACFHWTRQTYKGALVLPPGQSLLAQKTFFPAS